MITTPSDIPVWIHTSAASPYRKHLFELFAQEYPRARFFFTLHEGHKWLKYQAWNLSTKDWKIKVTNLRLRIPVPRLAFIHLDYIWHLLFQPPGTVHLVGGVYGNGWLIMLFCLLRHSYFVLWGDGGFPESLSDKPASWLKRFSLKHTAASFNAGKLGFEFHKKWGVSPERIFNAFFSHDIAAFKDFYMTRGTVDRKKIRESLKIAEGDIVVLCVARLLALKRLEDLAEAMLLIERDNPDLARRLHWVMIGDGEHRAHEERVSRFTAVRYHGIRRVEYDEIKGWFCAADMLSFPSEGDIWGLVVNEALSLGVPVICTERVGSAELVRDGWNGFKTKVRAPEEIAAAIQKLATQPEVLAQMKANALSIWETWNSERAIEEFRRLVAAIRPAEQNGRH